MNGSIRVSAKTVDDAITEALIQLGVTSDRLEYEVIEKGSPGFLGIGMKQAVIEARRKPEPEPEPQPQSVQEEPVEEPVVVQPEPVPQPEPVYQQPEPEYYDPEPADPASGGKISTVEFAIAPKPDEPEQNYYDPSQEAQPADDLPDASGLYADIPPEQPKKASRGRSAGKKTTTRKPKATKQPKGDTLPAAFDSFQGVDYND